MASSIQPRMDTSGLALSCELGDLHIIRIRCKRAGEPNFGAYVWLCCFSNYTRRSGRQASTVSL